MECARGTTDTGLGDAIAVIGDGAISAGMAYEAMNNAGHLKKRLIVILNDNEMSIAPPVGAMSSYLSRLYAGDPFQELKAAAKGAVEGLVRSLAAEWAPKIRVNAIAPALTDTPLAARLLSSPEKREAMAARYPLKRIGTAADAAALARFLLSDESSWMTGQVLGLDGGLSKLRV